MYISMCLKDHETFKKGEFYDTYQEGKHCFVRREGTNDYFKKIYFYEYREIFTHVDYLLHVPMLRKVKKRWLFIKRKTKFEMEKFYWFNSLPFNLLRKIQKQIFLPIELLKREGNIILTFSDSIHYSLTSLEEFCKVRELLDIETEIDRISVYLYEVLNLARQISCKTSNCSNNKRQIITNNSIEFTAN